MASSVNTGLIRIGILLSVIWVLAVGAFAFAEGNRRNDLCAITPETGPCKRFFWKWENPPRATSTVDALDENKEQKAEAEKPKRGFLTRKLAAAIVKGVETVKGREFRPQPGRIAAAIFGPLALFWALGFGVVWCVAGFRKKK